MDEKQLSVIRGSSPQFESTRRGGKNHLCITGAVPGFEFLKQSSVSHQKQNVVILSVVTMTGEYESFMIKQLLPPFSQFIVNRELPKFKWEHWSSNNLYQRGYYL